MVEKLAHNNSASLEMLVTEIILDNGACCIVHSLESAV